MLRNRDISSDNQEHRFSELSLSCRRRRCCCFSAVDAVVIMLSFLIQIQFVFHIQMFCSFY